MLFSRRFHTLLVCTVVVVIVMVIMVVSQLQTEVGAAASSRVGARGLVGANVTSTRYTAKSIGADTPTITNTSTSTATPRRTSTPTPIGVGHTAKSIAAGVGYTCVILDDDNTKCWGVSGISIINDVGITQDKVYFGTGRTAKAIAAGY